MASVTVQKRPGRKNLYLVWWQNGKQTWRSTGTDDEDTARDSARQLQAVLEGQQRTDALRDLLEKAGATDLPTRVPLDGLWEFYTKHAQVSGGERQVRSRRAMLKAFVEWMGGRHPEVRYVHEVSLRIAGEYWKWMETDGKAPRTRNNIRSQLLLIWQGIRTAAELPLNPWESVQRDQGGGESYRHLTAEEIRELLRQAEAFTGSVLEPGFWPAAILLGQYTGLREGDIAQLEWDELQWEEGFIELQPNKTKHWRKDRVSVHTLDSPWVDRLPARRKESGFVWPTAAKASQNSWHALAEEFIALCGKAGIKVEREPEKGERRKRNVKLVTFHSLRHSFTTLLLASGKVTKKDLVDQGNWSNEQIIDNVYNHAKREAARRAAVKVAAAWRDVGSKDERSKAI